MGIPILFLYAIGILAFIIGLEEEEPPNNMIYLGVAFLVNGMAYYLSYTNTDYTQAAYLPLVLGALAVVVMIWRGIGMIPTSLSWDEEADKDD